MNDFEFLKNFNNKATDFLIKRLKQFNYRGQHLVQHYRYNFDIIYNILNLLNKYAPNKTLLAIRTSDLTKQPIDLPEWKNYALFCNEIYSVIGKGTQDSIRKILFVDLERMGLISRFNKEQELNEIYTKNKNYYVSLTDDAFKVLGCKNELDKCFLISKFANSFLNGCIENLLEILKETDIDYVTTYEYMFFITAINFKSSFEITKKEAIEYIKEYKKLAKSQQTALIKTLTEIMKTKEGDTKGLDRKDFHNWKNETQSLFDNFLNNVVYFNFDIQDDYKKIFLSDKDGIFEEKQKRLERSILEKKNYFDNHKVDKKDGFELHHIIPLAYSTSLEHFKLLDRWQNLIYIDAYSHRQIRQHIILESGIENDLKLLDYMQKEIYLKDKDNVLYGYNQKQTMLDKNKELREIK